MPKSVQSRATTLKFVGSYICYLFIVWGLYRAAIPLPQEVDEFLLKPLIWLVPLFFIVFKKEKLGLNSLGITTKNLFPAIYFSFGLGAIFAIEGMLINFLKYDTFNFSANIGSQPLLYAFGLSIATAISEEISFRGYVFNRLEKIFENEIIANVVATFFWTLLHAPLVFFVLKLPMGEAGVYLAITAIFGLGAGFVFSRTQNVFSSILLHLLWQWPIILFR